MDENNMSFEPMDIDLSAHSINDMDISVNESNQGIDMFIKKINETITTPITVPRDKVTEMPPPTPSDQNTTNIKKIHITKQKDTESTCTATQIKIVCAALVLFLSAVAFQVLSIQCSDGISPAKLRESLSNKLYGQMKTIDALVEGLIANEGSKVLILYGSTGVGKTLAASILLEHVGSYSNVYHYTMPSFMKTFPTDLMVGFVLCKETIIIIDDLNPNDLEINIHIQNLLSKSNDLDKVVTVLLIYNNCDTAKDFRRQCDESFPYKIMNNLKQVKAYKKIIRFESLTEEHLRKCIETELGPKKITNDEFRKVLKNFDVTIDGCKGVHTKMKHLDIS